MGLENKAGNVEVGNIVEGKITGIAKFGAFVELISQKATGLVHISEISNDFVKNVSDHFKEGQIVKVKVLSISKDGKMELSIKQAATPKIEKNVRAVSTPSKDQVPDNQKPPAVNNNFEDMMAKFKRISADKLCDINRQTEVRRSRNGNRGN